MTNRARLSWQHGTCHGIQQTAKRSVAISGYYTLKLSRPLTIYRTGIVQQCRFQKLFEPGHFFHWRPIL